MKFWWVNQNKTWKQEIEGGYMWSPKKNSAGEHVVLYDNMLYVQKGDLVFSYYKKQIGSIGTVANAAHESAKPTEFGNAGEDWEREGWKVNMHYKELQKPLVPLDIFDQLKEVLPNKYSPLNKDGGGYQGYLFSIPEGMAAILLSHLVIDHL
tara:strand:+ start:2745 stop:3200 length:456 start_codon:yes stop_codon:yes gene_type:complete